jgi:hypothetical protein
MERFKEDFPSKIEGIDFKSLENSNHTIFGLSKELNLIYFNPAYVLFAQKNGFEGNIINKFPIDTPFSKIISEEKLVDFYNHNYKSVLSTGDIWRHEYECSSSNEFRQFHQAVYPLRNGNGLMVINTLRVNLPMKLKDRKAHDALTKRYTQSNGFINQCSNCRHCQRAEQEEIWDWVPDWVERTPDNLSHTICPTCFDYHWKYAGNNGASTNST